MIQKNLATFAGKLPNSEREYVVGVRLIFE